MGAQFGIDELILKNLGKIDESIVNYKLALSIDPKSTPISVTAILYFKLGEVH